MASVYDEAPAAAEGDLVVPDYSAPAAASGGMTAMGSDGSTGPPAPPGTGLARYALVTVPPDPLATDKVAAGSLAEIQTVIANVAYGMGIVTIFHSVMAATILDEGLDDWLNVAYVITSIAMMGWFGQKHKDKNLILAFVISCSLWFLFMAGLNYNTLDGLWNSCETDANGAAITSQSESCHFSNLDKELCQPPTCDRTKVDFDMRHPFAEVFPDCVITVLLVVGMVYGFKLYSHPSVDTNPRSVA